MKGWTRIMKKLRKRVGRGEKSRKVSHGFSFILTAGERRDRAKTLFDPALTSGDSILKRT